MKLADLYVGRLSRADDAVRHDAAQRNGERSVNLPDGSARREQDDAAAEGGSNDDFSSPVARLNAADGNAQPMPWMAPASSDMPGVGEASVSVGDSRSVAPLKLALADRPEASARQTAVADMAVGAPAAQPSLAKAAGTTAPAVASVEPALLHRWLSSRLANALFGVLSIGSVLLFWHLATHYRLDFYVRFGNIPSPGDVIDKVMEVNQSPKFMHNIGVSVRRILLGFLAATVLGTLLGVLIGRYRLMRQLSMPALEVFRPIPAIAWVPMAIMLWPSNEVSIVFITFLGAFFPILLNTIHGVEEIDDVLLRAARSLGTREIDLLLQVVIPGALQHIFTGLAVGMGVAWVSLIAAEMISGQFGIGYFTWEAYSLISYAEIALGMITIGVLGLLCSGAIRLCARKAMPWMHCTGGRT